MVLLAVLALAASVAAAALDLAPRQSRPLATVYTTCKTANTVALTFDDGAYIFEPVRVQSVCSAPSAR